MKNVAPLEIVSEQKNEFGLSAVQMVQALEIQKKFPQIVTAIHEAKNLEKRIGEQYFTACDELRKSGINGRECSLLLQSLGYRKQRITEIKKLVASPHDIWEKYRTGVLGFNAAVKIARDGKENVDEAGSVTVSQSVEADTEDNGTDVGSVPVVTPLPEPILAALMRAVKKTPLGKGKYVAMTDTGLQISITVK